MMIHAFGLMGWQQRKRGFGLVDPNPLLTQLWRFSNKVRYGAEGRPATQGHARYA